MSAQQVKDAAGRLAEEAEKLSGQANKLSEEAGALERAVDALGTAAQQAGGGVAIDPLVLGLTVFVLAVFVGYYVVWRVTPALHSPLMGVTNAISSVIVVGALLALGKGTTTMSEIFGFLAVVLASVNIFGGFIVTQRMLQMFRKKK